MLAIDLVTVPYDSGRRGYRMGAGPQALLRAGLVQKLRAAGHDVELVPVETTGTAGDELSVALDLAGRVARVTRATRSAGRFPLVVSGSCFSTVGAFAGLEKESAGVIWLDAHGDLNTPETSPGGFVDGMAAAVLLGWCHAERAAAIPVSHPSESRLMVVGARALDPEEATAMQQSAIIALTVAEAKDETRLTAAVDAFAASLTAVYLHIDLDVLDPIAVGRANEFAAPDGLTLSDVNALVRTVGARVRIAGVTLSAYDPAADADGAVGRAAGEIITSALAAADA